MGLDMLKPIFRCMDMLEFCYCGLVARPSASPPADLVDFLTDLLPWLCWLRVYFLNPMIKKVFEW